MLRYFFTVIFWMQFILYLIFSSIYPAFRLVSFFSKILLFLSGIRTKVLGMENLNYIDPKQGLIIAANHASFLDYFVLQSILPQPVSFVVWPVGFKIPLLKTIYRRLGYIPAGIYSRRHYDPLKRGGRLVVFSFPAMDKVQYPESIIKLSVLYHVPILPVGITNAAKVLPLGKYALEAGSVGVAIGRPQFFSSASLLEEEITKLWKKPK